MKSLRKTKGLSLFVLSLPTTIFGERHDDGYVPYNFLYRRLLLRKASIRYAISQLVKTGEVNKIRRKSLPYGPSRPLVALSTLGRKRLRELLPGLFPAGKSKFGFLLAVFSQVSSRESNQPALRKLRQALQELGFVQIARGIYGGWQDLSEEAEKQVMRLHLSQEVWLIPFEKATFFKPHELSYKLLRLEEQTQTCLKLINDMQRLLKGLQSKKELSEKEKRTAQESLEQVFFQLRRLPALPKSLAPANWPVAELKITLKLLSEAI